MNHRRTTTWSIEFDRLEVIELRELVESLDKWIEPPERAALATVTFASPRLSLDEVSRDKLRALVQNGSGEMRRKIWEALA